MSARRVEDYVDAVLGRRALERAIALEGATPGRSEALLKARIAVKNAEAKLNGTQIGQARRLLSGTPERN